MVEPAFATTYGESRVPQNKSDETLTKANALKGLGLFKGISDTDFDLNRKPTRIEALIMFIRLIGEEKAALDTKWSHPFNDVPSWASNYVGYAYQKGYTKGLSTSEFGSIQSATADMYLTFVLRALAYVDGHDFQWNNPYDLARSIALLPDHVNTNTFLRGDVVLISWSALGVPLKEGNKALGDLLVMTGIFSQSKLDNAFKSLETSDQTPNQPHTLNGIAGVKYGTYICYEDANGFEYADIYYPKVTLNSDGTFLFDINFGEGMLTVAGTYSAVEDEVFGAIIRLKVTSHKPDGNLEETYLFTADFGPDRIGLTDNYAGLTSVESVFVYQD